MPKLTESLRNHALADQLKTERGRMKEISEKLAHELVDRLNKLESWCDEKAKEGRPTKGDVDTDWMTASCLCHDIRTHLYWHMGKDSAHPAESPQD